MNISNSPFLKNEINAGNHFKIFFFKTVYHYHNVQILLIKNLAFCCYHNLEAAPEQALFIRAPSGSHIPHCRLISTTRVLDVVGLHVCECLEVGQFFVVLIQVNYP